jgi:hypothetical protein
VTVRLWKALGLAGIGGVAATGIIMARNQRARANLTPEQVRQRLLDRVNAMAQDAQVPAEDPGDRLAEPGSTESSARA